jgi:hypothetical protein
MRLSTTNVIGLILGFAVSTILATSAWAQPGPHFGPWSALEPVSVVNTDDNEMACSISHDGLRLYFQRGVPGNIWVSHRESTKADWGEPVMLPDTINTAANEVQAFESIDGHWLYFGSNRPGGLGGMDIWVSWRQNKHDDTAWEAPVNVSAVNTAGFENAPMLFVDECTGTTQLYFGAAPGPGGTQPFADIYMSTLGPTGFGSPVAVSELNVAGYLDGKPWLRRDGLEIFFVSYRNGPGPMVTGAIYSATRESTEEPWSDPFIAIGRSASGEPGDAWITTPVLSWDAQTLYVGVNQMTGTDNGDIYVAHREKVTGRRSIDLAPFEPARSYRFK